MAKKLPAITGLPSHKVPPPLGNVKLPSTGSVNRSVAKEKRAATVRRVSKLNPDNVRPSIGSVGRSVAASKKAAMEKRISKLNSGNTRPSLGSVRSGAAKETAGIKKGIKAGTKTKVKLPSVGSAVKGSKPKNKPPVRKSPKKYKVAKGSGSTGTVMSAPSDISFDPYNFKY